MFPQLICSSGARVRDVLQFSNQSKLVETKTSSRGQHWFCWMPHIEDGHHRQSLFLSCSCHLSKLQMKCTRSFSTFYFWKVDASKLEWRSLDEEILDQETVFSSTQKRSGWDGDFFLIFLPSTSYHWLRLLNLSKERKRCSSCAIIPDSHKRHFGSQENSFMDRKDRFLLWNATPWRR